MPEFPVAFIDDERGRLIVSESITDRGIPRSRSRDESGVTTETAESEAAIAAILGSYVAPRNDPIRLARGLVRHCLSTGWCLSSVDVKDTIEAVGVLYKPGADMEMHVRGERAFFATLCSTTR